jgi:hypothetical protein
MYLTATLTAPTNPVTTRRGCIIWPQPLPHAAEFNDLSKESSIVKTAVGYLITTNGITAKDGPTDTVWQRTVQVQQTNDAQGTKP